MNKYGHGARTPLQIPPRGWFDIGKSVFVKIGDDNVSLIAAGIERIVGGRHAAR